MTDPLPQGAVIGILGGGQLGRMLSVDTKLAWKITNLLEHRDPFKAGLYVPGSVAVDRFLAAARKKQAPVPLIERARRSFEEFDDLVRVHAGDRKSLDMMFAGQESGKNRTAELEHRKAGFLANSYLWGVQARLQLKTAIVAPSTDPQRLEAVVLNGFVGLRRIRPQAPWRITSAYSVDDEGRVHTSFGWSPLDPSEKLDSPTQGPPLVKQFCSADLPEIEIIPGEAGAVHYAFREGPIGRRGAVTCVIGETLRAVEPRYSDPPYEMHATYLRLHTPTQAAVQDLLVHRDLFDGFRPKAKLFSGLYAGELFTSHRACDELPVLERVESLGAGSEVARLSEMPDYRALLHFALDQVGWNPDDFQVHRIRIPYPPTPTALVVRDRLPPDPKS